MWVVTMPLLGFCAILLMLHIGFLCIIQSADDEILVRDVLYDALILVDYSFINKGAGVDQADSSLLLLYVSRLLITHDAINDAR